MNSHYKNTFLILGISGLIALATILLIYDRLPKDTGSQGLTASQRQQILKNVDVMQTKDIISSIDKEISIIDQQYNFLGDLPDLQVPAFAKDLTPSKKQ